MSRTVKDHQERRAEILETARSLFFSNGYENTSVQEIIDAVGIAKGTFYYYFDSKVDLLDALIKHMTGQQIHKACTILAEPELDAAQKLGRIFSELEGWKTDNRDFFLDILRTWFSDENIIVRHKFTLQARHAMRPLLVQVIRQGLDEGIFNTSYPEHIGDVIMGVLQNSSEELSLMLVEQESHEAALANLEEILAVNQHAINLLLGAQPGTVQIYNLDRLRLWFE